MASMMNWALIISILSPFVVLSQDSTKTMYRSSYKGVCRASVRFLDSPPFRYWCKVPNRRAIQVPINRSHIDVLRTVSVCALQRLTRRDEDSPCGFREAILLWSGQPKRSIEISNTGFSFGDSQESPTDIYVVVELGWNGMFPEDGNLLSIGYASLSRALRHIKVRLEGIPKAATLIPVDTTIQVGRSGYVKLLAARKSLNGIWLDNGQATMLKEDETHSLNVGVVRTVPPGKYEIRTNGYLPEGTGKGFFEIELEYETGP